MYLSKNPTSQLQGGKILCPNLAGFTHFNILTEIQVTKFY